MSQALKALILETDGRIAAVLESDQDITPELMAATPYAGLNIRAIEHLAEYSEGRNVAEYTEDGTLRPLIDRIQDGLCPVPEGYELVEGELVPVNPTPEETPEHLQKRLDAEWAKVAMLEQQVTALQKELLGL